MQLHMRMGLVLLRLGSLLLPVLLELDSKASAATLLLRQ
jgi:hypothetical protein